VSEKGIADKSASAVKIMATFVVYFRLLFQIAVYLNDTVCDSEYVALEGRVIYYALNGEELYVNPFTEMKFCDISNVHILHNKGKGKVILLQARCGPEGG